MKKEKAEGEARGEARGEVKGKTEERAEAVMELLEDIGEPSEALRKHIMKQTDLELLRG